MGKPQGVKDSAVCHLTSCALLLNTLSRTGKPSGVLAFLAPLQAGWDCLGDFLCSAYVTDHFVLPRADRGKATKLNLSQVKSCLFLNDLGRQCKGHWLIFFPFPPNKSAWAVISARTLLLLCHLGCAKNLIKYQHFILPISDQILTKNNYWLDEGH